MQDRLNEDLEYIASMPLPWEAMKDAVILVTGATGLVGSILVKTLSYLSKKYALRLKIIAHVQNLEYAEQKLNVEDLSILQGDIREPVEWKGDLDYIIHCASVTKSCEISAQPLKTFEISVQGTKNMLAMAAAKNVRRMVYLSSMEVYGDMSQWHEKEKVFLTTEDKLGSIDLANPRSAYQEGKRAAECLCHIFHSQYGVPVMVARLTQTFGAGVGMEESRVFAQFAKSAMLHKPIIMHTDGESEGNYCYLADTMYGILTILLKGKIGETYNIAHEKLHMTVYQMAEYVANNIAQGQISITKLMEYDHGQYPPPVKLFLSAAKLRELGWSPHFTMRDMYERMLADWIKD